MEILEAEAAAEELVAADVARQVAEEADSAVVAEEAAAEAAVEEVLVVVEPHSRPRKRQKSSITLSKAYLLFAAIRTC